MPSETTLEANSPSTVNQPAPIRWDVAEAAVNGDLTLHGVTREITVDLEGPTPEIKDPWGNFRRGTTGTAKIDRRDFGITWNRALDTGGLVVGNDVMLIYVEIEWLRK